MLNRQEQQPNNAPLPAEDGKELSQIIKVENEEQAIWITPVCSFFKISYENHRKLIKSDPILQSIQIKKSDYLAFGDNRQRILLPKLGFIRWIQLINPNTVDPELREKFKQFQVDVFKIAYSASEKRTEHAALYKEYIALKQQAAATSSRLRAVKKELDTVVEQQMLGTEVIDRQHSLPL